MPVPTNDDRFHDAVGRALLAFYMRLAKEYPEITTGDVAIDRDEDFLQAATRVAGEWVVLNGADVLPTHDQLGVLQQVVSRAQGGEFGDHNRGRCYAISARQSTPTDDPLIRPDARNLTITVLWQDAKSANRETQIVVGPEGNSYEVDR